MVRKKNVIRRFLLITVKKGMSCKLCIIPGNAVDSEGTVGAFRNLFFHDHTLLLRLDQCYYYKDCYLLTNEKKIIYIKAK